MRLRLPFPANLWARLSTTEPDECWRWLGSHDQDGYGFVCIGSGVIRRVHRVTYQMFRGPIPEGLTIDHLCRVRDCANPDHLEAVTIGENVLRGNTIQARNAAKTHCLRGHEFSPENTRRNRKGSRVCIACGRRAVRLRRATAEVSA